MELGVEARRGELSDAKKMKRGTGGGLSLQSNIIFLFSFLLYSFVIIKMPSV